MINQMDSNGMGFSHEIMYNCITDLYIIVIAEQIFTLHIEYRYLGQNYVPFDIFFAASLTLATFQCQVEGGSPRL